MKINRANNRTFLFWPTQNPLLPVSKHILEVYLKKYVKNQPRGTVKSCIPHSKIKTEFQRVRKHVWDLKIRDRKLCHRLKELFLSQRCCRTILFLIKMQRFSNNYELYLENCIKRLFLELVSQRNLVIYPRMCHVKPITKHKWFWRLMISTSIVSIHEVRRIH